MALACLHPSRPYVPSIASVLMCFAGKVSSSREGMPAHATEQNLHSSTEVPCLVQDWRSHPHSQILSAWETRTEHSTVSIQEHFSDRMYITCRHSPTPIGRIAATTPPKSILLNESLVRGREAAAKTVKAVGDAFET